MNDPELSNLVALVTLGYFLLLLLLIARVSHWTYRTQMKLDETNRLLAKIAGEAKPAETQPENPGV